MTHTPGPWLIEPTDNTPRGHWLHDDRHQYVALAVGRDDGGRITGGELEFGEARTAIAKAEGLS